MAQIAADTPDFLINLLKNVDINKLDQNTVDKWVYEFHNKIAKQDMIKKYLRDPNSAKKMEAPAGIPQNACDAVSSIDWGKVGFMTRTAAKPYINNWVKENLPMKR